MIVVSHDRDFLNGLVDKVYEFGNQQVKEHLGGIYEFLERKKMDSLKELEVAATQKQEAQPQEESVNKLSYEERKELSRQIKKLEKQISEAEEVIEKKEAEISEIETRLATAEGAADTALFERHGLLTKELQSDMAKWEELTTELENISTN